MTNFAKRALADLTFVPFWLDRTDIPADELPLTGRTETDLLIVGGGFTGLWAAILAKEASPGRGVVLIEAETVASGASGRPGGIVSTSIMHGLANAVRVFPEDLERLEALGRANLQGFRGALDRYGVDTDLEWNGEMTVAAGEGAAALLDKEEALHRRYGHDVVRFDSTAIQAEIDSPLFEGGLWSRRDSGTVHPDNRTALRRATRLYRLAEPSGRLRHTHPAQLHAPHRPTIASSSAEGSASS